MNAAAKANSGEMKMDDGNLFLERVRHRMSSPLTLHSKSKEIKLRKIKKGNVMSSICFFFHVMRDAICGKNVAFAVAV